MPIAKVTARSERKLQDVADALQKAKKVVVFTGAGISTNSGIPDFRSKDGLYSLIKADYDSENPGSGKVVSGKDLFDSGIWRDADTTATFYKFIASLRNKIHNGMTKATKAHRLLRVLRDERKLVRCYTQNIDGLESRVGLSTDLTRGKGNGKRFTAKGLQTPGDESSILKGSIRDGGCEVVQLHGDLVSLRCLNNCPSTCAWQELHTKDFLRGVAPECPSCAENNSSRLSRGKRSTKVGSLRPNVVLYGEQNPLESELSTMIRHDLSLGPDLILILGTSLKVHGLKVLVKEFAKAAHGGKKPGKVVFVNHTAPSASAWGGAIDYWVQMDCDQWVQGLRERVPDLFKKQQELSPKYMTSLGSTGPLKAISSLSAKNGSKENVQISVCSKYFPRDPSPSAQRIRRLQDSPVKRLPLSASSSNTNAIASKSSKDGDKITTPHKNTQLPTPPTSRRVHAPKAMTPRKREADMMAPATLDDLPASSPSNHQSAVQERRDLVSDLALQELPNIPPDDSPNSVPRKRSVHWIRPTDPRDLHQLYPSKRRKVAHDFEVFKDNDVRGNTANACANSEPKTPARNHSPPCKTTSSPIQVVIQRKEILPPSPVPDDDNDGADKATQLPPLTVNPIDTDDAGETPSFTVPETPKRASKVFPLIPLTPTSTSKATRSSPRKKKKVVVLVASKREGRERTGLLGGKFETFWRKRPRDGGAMRFEFDAKGLPVWVVGGC